MTEKIGFLWQDGEKLAAAGSVHEALLQFQRAKTLLIAESHCFFSNGEQKESRIPPVYGEIMTKLTRSIDKNVTFLHNHPVYTLGVSKNYTHKEIKKAYRAGALKYHPDKNKDCDSSCVFTALQAAYETLLVTAPKDHKESTIRRENSSASAKPPSRHSSHKDYQPQTQHKPQPAQSSFRKTPQPTQPSSQKQTPSSSDNLHRAARNRDASIASIVSMMTTAELRKVLSKFGFNNLEGSSREELVKKYLALHTHFSKAEKSSTSSSSKPPHDTWAEQMRSEMNNARRKEQNQRGAPKRSASMNDPRHKEADDNRNQRAERLKRELPKMSLSELRRMMHTCGISMTGCVEKYDLLEKLCVHYGISVDDLILTSTATPSATPRAESESVPQSNSKTDSHSSSEHSRCNHEESKKQEKSAYASVFGKSESVPPAPAAASTTASNKADYIWTKQRLREMEAKLHRHGRRQSAPKPQAPQPEEEDVVPPCMQHFMNGHADLFKEVRTVESVHMETPRDGQSNGMATSKNSPAAASVESQPAPVVTPGHGLLDDDSDNFSDTSDDSSDSGIQWRPEKTSEKYAHVHIPDLPLGGYVSEESLSEEEIFDNPFLTPSQLKSMRFHRAVHSTSQKDLHVNVGVSLLSDDESSDEEFPTYTQFNPKQYYNAQGSGSPMSATAWSGVFQR